jgi:PAS domain S-box-containing protein
MPSTNYTSQAENALRQQAEAFAQAYASDVTAEAQASSSPHAMLEAIHELRVHQIELEMQNEELRRTQAERDTAQARYFDFYDLAPVGYVTVSDGGLILHANLTAAALLGVTRSQLAEQPLNHFIDREDQDTYYLLQRQLLECPQPQSSELRMVKKDGNRFFARVDAIATMGDDGEPVLRLVLIDITAHQRAEQELRIAAVAFEAQEAIVVMDSQRQILRVNLAFTEISGYTEQELLGETISALYSKRHSASFYENIWRTTDAEGRERSDRWVQHKSGADLFAQGTTTAVKDPKGQTTHYVITFSDQTLKYQREQQRAMHEAAHKEALVREVHHRIKNNLQGIGGLLRQFARQKPEIAAQIQLVTGHLDSISVIHGLRGRHDKSRVRLCELTREIAQATSALWQTTIFVDIPTGWIRRVVDENEAVSVALVIGELLVNAVKHGGKAQGLVNVTLRQGQGIEGVELSILNAGDLCPDKDRPTQHHHGLELIESLRPRVGLTVTLAQCGNQVRTVLQLSAPVLTLDTEN